jgi:hypothetical protein
VPTGPAAKPVSCFAEGALDFEALAFGFVAALAVFAGAFRSARVRAPFVFDFGLSRFLAAMTLPPESSFDLVPDFHGDERRPNFECFRLRSCENVRSMFDGWP